MKTIRVLSPIEPGELCWVRVDGEWWLVRAHERKTDCCTDCEIMGNGWDVCETIPCGDMGFTRVHPIPMPENPEECRAGNVYKQINTERMYLAEKDGAFSLALFGPPEE